MRDFKSKILENDIFDPVGIHHEFAYGDHGRKLDFDLITDGSPLYREWVQVNVEFIRQQYTQIPEVILGVANGTNRLARDVAKELGVLGLSTEKVGGRSVQLTQAARQQLIETECKLLLVLEDVGTTGGSAYSAAVNAREAGAQRVEVIFSWQRSEDLIAFKNTDIPYCAIVQEVLPNYSPEECKKIGYCSMGWELIARTS